TACFGPPSATTEIAAAEGTMQWPLWSSIDIVPTWLDDAAMCLSYGGANPYGASSALAVASVTGPGKATRHVRICAAATLRRGALLHQPQDARALHLLEHDRACPREVLVGEGRRRELALVAVEQGNVQRVFQGAQAA